jgi:hypothetical protein
MKPTFPERKTAVLMLILTALYLTVELAFNARLLDTVGGTASAEEIDKIEIYGRWISGAALTLFAWSGVFKKSLTSGVRPLFLATKLLFSAAVCCGAMYVLQEFIIRTVVATSTGESRARAAILVPVTHILTKENVTLKDLDVTAADYQTPEGKSFLATFALQAIAVPELGVKMRKVADAMFGRVAEEMRGGVEGAYAAYRESQQTIEKQYQNDYLKGNRSYQSAVYSIPRRQRDAWVDYEHSLVEHRWKPSTVPGMYAGRVRSNVQQKVPVPNNWNPADQQTFYAAVAGKVQSEAQQEFSSKSDGLQPNLSLAQFMATASVQDKWRTALKISSLVVLTPGLSPVQFSASTYDDIIAGDLNKLKADRLAKPSAYSDSGYLDAVGRDSIRVLAVPPIALFFSLLGAFTHLFKCMLWTSKMIVTIPTRFVFSAFALYVGLVFTVPLFLTNRFTVQPLYVKLENDTKAQMPYGTGHVVSRMLRWAIQMQHYFYPVNESVRIYVLNGMSFGYHDKSIALQPKEKLNL